MSNDITIHGFGNARSSWECHRCKKVNAPHADHCDCAATVQPVIVPFIQPDASPFWPSYPAGTITVSPNLNVRCMFDNLPPGVYGIACPCPKCTPQYSSNVYTVTMAADGTWESPYVLASTRTQ